LNYLSTLLDKFVSLPMVSDQLSIAGLIITILGFAITISSVIKSKKAAEKASKQVEVFKQRLSAFDISTDISSAIEMIEQIKRLQRAKSWPGVLDQYSQLRRRMIAVKSNGKGLSEKQSTQLQATIQLTARIEEQLDAMLFEEGKDVNVAYLNKAISKQLGGLMDIVASIRQDTKVSHE
jgi:hypothetical protein